MYTVKLPERLLLSIIHLPHDGANHRLVNVYLKNGMMLTDRKVINSEILILDGFEDLDVNEIEIIESAEELSVETR